MEYIFFSNSSLNDTDAKKIFDSKRISSLKASNSHRIGPHRLITNGRVAIEKNQLFAFNGTGFFDGAFLNNFSQSSDSECIQACNVASKNPASATGTFTVLIADTQTGDAEVLLDDLNSSPCFTAGFENQFAISNNHHMLADWLRAQGVTPTRSIEPGLSHLVFSSGQTVGNLYEEINLVRPEERPVVHKGKLDFVQNDPIWPGLLDASYDELIEAAAARIRDQLLVLTETSDYGHRVFDVTGGMDSRIVLAALAGAGIVREWHYQNHLNPNQPDGNFAFHIAEKYNLRRMFYPFFLRQEPGVIAKARMGSFLSLGSFSFGIGNFDVRRSSLVHATGMFGELGGKSQDIKRFFPNEQTTLSGTEAKTDSLVETYLESAKVLNGETGCNHALLSWARQQIAQQVHAARSHDLSLEQMPTIFYRRGKARSHFGESAHHRSMRLQFAGVLNSPYLTAASLKLGTTKSAAGRVNFDLIRRLGGDEIAALPLAKDLWRKEMFDDQHTFSTFSRSPLHAGDAHIFENEPEIDVGPEPEFEPVNAAAWHPSLDFTSQRHPDGPYASPAYGQIARYSNLAHQLLKDDQMSKEIAEFLPEKSLAEIISKHPGDHAHTGEIIHTLQFFCLSQMWMRGMEIPPFDA